MKIWHRQLGESISNITYHHLPALRWRNFRLFFGGHLLSMSGTFMTQQLTIPWLVLVFVGCFSILNITSSNMIIQTLVTEDKRGRVMSFYALAMVGTMPFGNLLAGTLADNFGATNALIVCGSLIILGALWFSAQLPAVSRWIAR
ncbi:MFS transporter [Nostoc sp.]|uniref:MFS transporter n=1 Tax=Nostoc sp. TaxID=1180 RepID=UPI002FFB1FE4